MSPARFPLVAFGGPERYYKDRLIDASEAVDTDELPPAMDAVAKERKYKEQMKAWDRD